MQRIKKLVKSDDKEKEEPLVSRLDDATRFSYIATCAVTLRELYYENEEDRSFCKHCLEKLLKHLNLPKQKSNRQNYMYLEAVENTAEALFEGQGCESAGPFVESLRLDETLKEFGLISIPQDLVTVAVKEGAYDSRHRMLIRRIAEILEIPWDEIETFEKAVVITLRQEEYELTDEEKKEKKQRAFKNKFKRGAFIGLATVGGGVLLGVTGGLAAPLLAAGIGTVIGAGSAAVLGSTVGVAIIGSLFGVAGASLGGYKMKKRVGDVEEFGFESLTSESDMHLTITVSGWLSKQVPDCKAPWKNLRNSGEQYTLRYETKYLVEMGQGIDYLMKLAVNAAVSEALKYTVLSAILAAITWPSVILSASNVIDNPWGVCVTRTVAAGKLLAEVLLSRQQGKRPVTLVGFSLGARVIFYCLRELASRKKSHGIVEDAILLGAPVTASPKAWRECGKVVSGRIVNGFSSGDWLLKFLYRTASVQMAIAGLQPIRWCDRKMVNVDFSKVVTSHTDYRDKLDYLLALVGLKVKQELSEDEKSIVPIGLAGNVLKPAARIQGVKTQVRTSAIPVGEEEGDADGEGRKSKVEEPKQEPMPDDAEYLPVFLVEDSPTKTDTASAKTPECGEPMVGQEDAKVAKWHESAAASQNTVEEESNVSVSPEGVAGKNVEEQLDVGASTETTVKEDSKIAASPERVSEKSEAEQIDQKSDSSTSDPTSIESETSNTKPNTLFQPLQDEYLPKLESASSPKTREETIENKPPKLSTNSAEVSDIIKSNEDVSDLNENVVKKGEEQTK